MFTEVGFVFVTAVLSALFFLGILEFEKRDIGISLIIYCVYFIFVCMWFEELHIKKDRFLIKCFYYEKNIKFEEIKFVVFKSNSIKLYSENNLPIHVFLNDGSKRYYEVLKKIKEQEIPEKTIKFRLF